MEVLDIVSWLLKDSLERLVNPNRSRLNEWHYPSYCIEDRKIIRTLMPANFNRH